MRTTFFVFGLYLIINVSIAGLAPLLITNEGSFPFKKDLDTDVLPPYIISFANFDGVHYLRIAQNGYGQYQQVFFPLYPFLIKITSGLFNYNYLLTGLLLSNLFFFL